MKYDAKLKENAIETLKACANENALLNQIVRSVMDEQTIEAGEVTAVKILDIFEKEKHFDRHMALFCTTCVIGIILDEVIEIMEKHPERFGKEWPSNRKKAKMGEKVKPHSPIFDLSTEKH